jgi:hypothetical protein
VSFNTMKASFQNILNRDDCSDAQATTFLQQGISRIQRDCRLPNMERTLIITPETTTNMFSVPLDLIQPIDVLVQDSAGTFYPLVKKAFRDATKVDSNDLPRVYARIQTTVYIFGSVPVGRQIMFLYYGNFSSFASGDDDNELSASTPDLAVYAALSYAGDSFQHPSTQMWEQRYQQIKTEVMAMAIDLDAEGGPQYVQSLYNDMEPNW